MKTIDVTTQVKSALDSLGYGERINKSKDISKAGIWNLMDALSGSDNSMFSVDEAEKELQRRGIL